MSVILSEAQRSRRTPKNFTHVYSPTHLNHTPVLRSHMLPPGHVYILGSNTGTLNVGVTSDLRHRIAQHKSGAFEGFAKKYGCHRLLFAEPFETITEAIAREKQLKGWRRSKKLALVTKANPAYKDLAEFWYTERLGPARSIAEAEKRASAAESEQTSRDPSTSLRSAQDDLP